MSARRLVDENGVPTVAGAELMFAALDEARVHRTWQEVARAEAAKRRDDPYAARPLGVVPVPDPYAHDEIHGENYRPEQDGEVE